jgi:hypothetical protein
VVTTSTRKQARNSTRRASRTSTVLKARQSRSVKQSAQAVRQPITTIVVVGGAVRVAAAVDAVPATVAVDRADC